MARRDKYGRGSAAANGGGFVDLAPGDTFAALEAQLKRRIADRFDNAVLGISATIGSKRNASELAKHLASGEEEEVHKFAAKNIGVLFARGQLGISHDDKKTVIGQRWITRFIRVFTPFRFAGDDYLATLTLKDVDPDKRIYAVEAVEINQDAKSRSTPRGAISEDLNSAPFQDLTSQLTDMISYYVGDVNRTHPSFVGRMDTFSTERTVELLEGIAQDFCAKHQAPSTKHQAPKFSIIIPVYNVAPYLRECLDSVLAQTYTDWEAICVDDGSTDGSGEILDQYAALDNRIRVIHQQNSGVSAARNAALEVVRGMWIGFVDADDWVAPNFLETVYRAVTDNQGADVFRMQNFTFRNGEIPVPIEGVTSDRELPLVDGLPAEILRAENLLATFHFFKYHVCKSIRFRPYICGEDRIFVFECLLKANCVIICSSRLYGYRRFREQSYTTTVIHTERGWLTELEYRLAFLDLLLHAPRDVDFREENWISSFLFREYLAECKFFPDAVKRSLRKVWRKKIPQILRCPSLSRYQRISLHACQLLPFDWVGYLLCLVIPYFSEGGSFLGAIKRKLNHE